VSVSTHGNALDRIAPVFYRAPQRFQPTGTLEEESRVMFAEKITTFARYNDIRLDRVECHGILMSRPADCTLWSHGRPRSMIIYLVEEHRGKTSRRYVDGGWKNPGSCTQPDPLDPDRCYLDHNSFTSPLASENPH
jgi:hypothetical protein